MPRVCPVHGIPDCSPLLNGCTALAGVPDFDGSDYVPERDHDRLATQLGRVQAAIGDGKWHTLQELATKTDAPHASVSAQLRNLRKRRFGGHTIERRHITGGLWEYRYIPREEGSEDA